MFRIDGPGATADKRFQEADGETGQPGTQVIAPWLNAVQEEIVSPILAAGGVLRPSRTDQLLEAVRSLSAAERAGVRNLLMNGEVRVWRRATSRSFPPAGVVSDYAADRWEVVYGNGTAVVSRGEFGLPSPAPGTKYWLQWDQTVSSATPPALRQWIEGVYTQVGRTVTLSLRARKFSAGTLVVVPRLVQHFGTGGAPTADVSVPGSPATMTWTQSWQVFTVSFELPAISAATLGTDPGSDALRLELEFPANDTYTARLSELQLEPGPNATPFERVPLALELARCARYYQTTYEPDVTPGTPAIPAGQLWARMSVLAGEPFAAAGGTVWGGLNWIFPVPMRAVPDVHWINPVTGGVDEVNAETVESVPVAADWVPNAGGGLGLSALQTGAPYRTGSFPQAGNPIQSTAHVIADAEFGVA